MNQPGDFAFECGLVGMGRGPAESDRALKGGSVRRLAPSLHEALGHRCPGL